MLWDAVCLSCVHCLAVVSTHLGEARWIGPILLRGPLRYYEYLVGQDDLSSLVGLTAKEIRRRFAVEGKKRTAEDESFPEEQADPEAAADEAYLAAMPPKAFVVLEPVSVQLGQLPAPQPWQVSLGGGRTGTVYFDNFTQHACFWTAAKYHSL